MLGHRLSVAAPKTVRRFGLREKMGMKIHFNMGFSGPYEEITLLNLG